MADGLTETREKRLLNWAEEIAALVSVQRDDLRRSRMELVAAQQVRGGPTFVTRQSSSITQSLGLHNCENV